MRLSRNTFAGERPSRATGASAAWCWLVLIFSVAVLHGHVLAADNEPPARPAEPERTVTEAEEEAARLASLPIEKLRQLAAEQGSAAAQYNLGVRYFTGQGVPQDYKEAVKWFRRAIEQGHAGAQNFMGVCHLNGQGVEQDYAKAVKWFRSAIEQGHVGALSNLGMCYFSGRGVRLSHEEALKLFHQAAEQGDVDTQWNLGVIYYAGEGVPQDYAKAAKWFRKAAEQGHPDAQYSLAVCYNKGHGVLQDYAEAYAWVNRAAAQDSQYVAARDEIARRISKYAAARDGIATRKSPEQVPEGQPPPSQFKARSLRPVPEADAANGSKPRSLRERGTGFFITASGYLLTSEHVVADAGEIKIVHHGRQYPASVVKTDRANDIALLKVVDRHGRNPEGFQPLPLISSRKQKLGAEVAAPGFPNMAQPGVEPELTRGEISGLAGIQDDSRHFQMKMSPAMQPGNSGGALVDMLGNVIGLITIRPGDPETREVTGSVPPKVGYALKSSFVLAFLDTFYDDALPLPEPHPEKDRDFGVVAEELKAATALILIY